MAKRSVTHYPVFFGVNLTEAQMAALDRIAQNTCRTRSDVVRFLINRSEQLIGDEVPSDPAVVGGGE
jgi:hypothetical protein